VDLHNVTESVLGMLTPQAGAKRIVLRHGDCAKGNLARADQLKTEQIVLNLLSNAVKFTPAGGHVTTTCGMTDDKAWVTVKDDGPGIPQEKHAEIFEPFVQLGRSLSTIREGAGLGLAICRDLARAMNGEVTVES